MKISGWLLFGYLGNITGWLTVEKRVFEYKWFRRSWLHAMADNKKVIILRLLHKRVDSLIFQHVFNVVCVPIVMTYLSFVALLMVRSVPNLCAEYRLQARALGRWTTSTWFQERNNILNSNLIFKFEYLLQFLWFCVHFLSSIVLGVNRSQFQMSIMFTFVL